METLITRKLFGSAVKNQHANTQSKQAINHNKVNTPPAKQETGKNISEPSTPIHKQTLQDIGKPTSDQISEAARRIAEHRKAKNLRGGNFGYLDGVINGKKVDDKIWRSTSVDRIRNEPQIFTATEVKGSNGRTWLRDVDSEYRMLNNLAHELGAKPGHVYPQVQGNLTIVSEHPYCSSCSNVIQQFQTMFPNIKLTLINGVK